MDVVAVARVSGRRNHCNEMLWNLLRIFRPSPMAIRKDPQKGFSWYSIHIFCYIQQNKVQKYSMYMCTYVIYRKKNEWKSVRKPKWRFHVKFSFIRLSFFRHQWRLSQSVALQFTQCLRRKNQNWIEYNKQFELKYLNKETIIHLFYILL